MALSVCRCSARERLLTCGRFYHTDWSGFIIKGETFSWGQRDFNKRGENLIP